MLGAGPLATEASGAGVRWLGTGALALGDCVLGCVSAGAPQARRASAIAASLRILVLRSSYV